MEQLRFVHDHNSIVNKVLGKKSQINRYWAHAAFQKSIKTLLSSSGYTNIQVRVFIINTH